MSALLLLDSWRRYNQYLPTQSLIWLLLYNARHSLSLVNINVLKILFNKTFAITEIGWKILNRRWMIVLALAGICNEIVRQWGTIDEWLWFQLLRTILILMFATYQFTLSKHYRLPTASNWGVVITK